MCGKELDKWTILVSFAWDFVVLSSCSPQATITVFAVLAPTKGKNGGVGLEYRIASLLVISSVLAGWKPIYSIAVDSDNSVLLSELTSCVTA